MRLGIRQPLLISGDLAQVGRLVGQRWNGGLPVQFPRRPYEPALAPFLVLEVPFRS